MDCNLKKIIDSKFNDNDQKIIVVRVFEMIEASYSKSIIGYSDFLEMEHVDFIMDASKRTFSNIGISFRGAFEESERVIISAFDPEIYGEEYISYPISILKVSSDDKTFEPSHRQLLGSVLSTGIKREKLGDIKVMENTAYIAVESSLSGFISSELIRVGKWRVSIDEVSSDDISGIDEKSEDISFTVKSLRLDAVVAEGFNLSRADGQALVESGRVKLNHIPVASKSKDVREGDLISVRGFGRLRIETLGSKTKKDRSWIQARRFR